MLKIQNKLFPLFEEPKNYGASTFIDNLKLPMHRWFRFSAGFSALWVKEVIYSEIEKRGNNIILLDPFAGSGTTLLSADECGINSYGIESQPFIAKIARLKTRWDCNIIKLEELARKVLMNANNFSDLINEYPKLIYKCYGDGSLRKLDGLKRAWIAINDGTIEAELVWLCLTSILRRVSVAGTAQWQYVLPRKTKKNPIEVFNAFESQYKNMIADISLFKRTYGKPRSTLIPENSMYTLAVPDKYVDLVITSPPYANNYDYGDATRLEMSFWGEVSGWGDLQEKARKNLIRSCSHQAALVNGNLEKILDDPDLLPIMPDIKKVTRQLQSEREHHAGRKHYHLMIAGYFSDIAKVWKNLRRMCKEGAMVCFVVGDSAPYGIHVPVERWLGELALSTGFKSYEFEKIRDRNVKWKNRKHRVPLQEGNLWIKG